MNKQELFAALESTTEEVEVKDAGLTLHFKKLTGVARDAFQNAIQSGDHSVSHFEAAIVAATVVDADGNAMFDADDLDALRKGNADKLTAIAAVALGLNKIGAKAEEEAAKN